MTSDFMEKRTEARTVVNEYYSVDLSVENESFLYQFKIWDVSSKGMCLLLKEGSAAMKHLNIGDEIKMKYYKANSTSPGQYLNTKITHITKYEEGQFKGHHLVGIQILEDPNS